MMRFVIWFLLHLCTICEQCIDSGGAEVNPILLQLRSHERTYNGKVDEEDFLLKFADEDGLVPPTNRSFENLPDAASTTNSHNFQSLFIMTCCIITCLGICMAILCLKWLEMHRVALDGSTTSFGRTHLLDNAKVFAMAAVIFFHLLIYRDNNPLLFDSSASRTYIKDALETVHMPVFSFVSGVCSQGPPTAKRIRCYIAYRVAPTILWGFIVQPVLSHYFGLNLDRAPWYLIALIMWRASALCWSHLHPVVVLVGTIGLSCLGMYLNLTWEYLGGQKYMFNACLGYLPYFAIGYVFPFKLACRAINPSSTQRLGAALLLILGLPLLHFLLTSLLPGESLPNAHGHSPIFAEDRWVGLWNNRLRWASRTAKVVVDTSASVVLIILVLPRHETCLTWVGSHTLYAYLLHGIAIGMKDSLVKALHLPQEGHWAVHVAVYLLYATYALVALVLLSSPPWRWLFQVFLSPTWLDRLLERLHSSAHQSADLSCAEVPKQ